MPSSISSRLLTHIRRFRLLAPGDCVAIAVSGGGDSVALLFLLLELRNSLGVVLRVAHFNHQLRPGEAGEDERFVRNLAAQYDLPCAVRSEDVKAHSAGRKSNLESEARARRYAFFRELVLQRWATRIATAHTADDQAETVVSRLARGTGLAGLRGIHPVFGPIVRPLLGLRRSELRDYLSARGQPWREDATNADTARQRARIRHTLLPLWQAEFGPGIVRNLARLAEMARNDEALIDGLVEERFHLLARREGADGLPAVGDCAIAAGDLLAPHPALQSPHARLAFSSRLVRRLAGEVAGGKPPLTAAHIASVLELAQTGISGSRLELPRGIVIERVLDRLVFSSRPRASRLRHKTVSYSYSASPGPSGEALVDIAETGKRLRLKLIDWPPAGSETNLPGLGALDADRLELPLVVRNRLPGDAYRPQGRRHAEKVKRLLAECRVPGVERARKPVIVSAGRLVWSAGLPVAADFAAGKNTRRALIISEEPG